MRCSWPCPGSVQAHARARIESVADAASSTTTRLAGCASPSTAAMQPAAQSLAGRCARRERSAAMRVEWRVMANATVAERLGVGGGLSGHLATIQRRLGTGGRSGGQEERRGLSVQVPSVLPASRSNAVPGWYDGVMERGVWLRNGRRLEGAHGPPRELQPDGTVQQHTTRTMEVVASCWRAEELEKAGSRKRAASRGSHGMRCVLATQSAPTACLARHQQECAEWWRSPPRPLRRSTRHVERALNGARARLMQKLSALYYCLPRASGGHTSQQAAASLIHVDAPSFAYHGHLDVLDRYSSSSAVGRGRTGGPAGSAVHRDYGKPRFGSTMIYGRLRRLR
jgi:hypothetical protein